jgi:Ca-activated chloride channel family protein
MTFRNQLGYDLLSGGMALLALGGSLRAQLRADVKLILVPVTVMDRRGAVVNGLDKSRFAVWDNQVAQKIISFSSEDVPCSVGLVLDISASMRDHLASAKDSLIQFIKLANPTDEFRLFRVTTKPLLYPDALHDDHTWDMGALQDRVRVATAGGDTALVDTIYAALLNMRHARNPRRALVIVSDGVDNHSRYSKQYLIRAAVEADVQMYTIGIFTAPPASKAVEQVGARNGLSYLEELSARTGGVHFVIQGRKEATAAAQRISSAIRNQYVIGFQPVTLDETGKWHRVQVKLDRSQVQVYARGGYYAH